MKFRFQSSDLRFRPRILEINLKSEFRNLKFHKEQF